MTTFIPLSEEQCREALVRLQNYAIWMYHTPEGVALFKRQTRTHNGRTYSVSIEPDGRIAMTLADNGAKIIYEVMTTTAPLRSEHTLDNVDYRARIANADDLLPSDVAYGQEVMVMALSLFQRTQAFQFFCRVEPETLTSIARDLALAYSS